MLCTLFNFPFNCTSLSCDENLMAKPLNSVISRTNRVNSQDCPTEPSIPSVANVSSSYDGSGTSLGSKRKFYCNPGFIWNDGLLWKEVECKAANTWSTIDKSYICLGMHELIASYVMAGSYCGRKCRTETNVKFYYTYYARI